MGLSKRNLRILLVSKTRDQSRGNLLDRLKNYIKDNEFLSELFIPKDASTSWNQQEVITKQGHWVRVCPYNTSIRGFSSRNVVFSSRQRCLFRHLLNKLFINILDS